jgi:phage FluMu protein Com
MTVTADRAPGPTPVAADEWTPVRCPPPCGKLLVEVRGTDGRLRHRCWKCKRTWVIDVAGGRPTLCRQGLDETKDGA